LKNLRRTLKGRVVYSRKKHEFSVKRLGNIAATLYTAEKGNMAEWRYINKIAGLAWAYWAKREGRLDELVVYFNGYDCCDPVIRTARDFYNFVEWLIRALDKLAPIPYVGIAAELGGGILRALYDHNVHRKLIYAVLECERRLRGDEQGRKRMEEAGERIGSAASDIIEDIEKEE
jgi:hypothetical protein